MGGNNIALFDLDGSLADYDGSLNLELSRIRGPAESSLAPDRLWAAEKTERSLRRRIDLIRQVPGFWLNLKPIKNGMRILAEARALGYDIHILTKGPKKAPNAWKEKVEWCQKHFGERVDIHITSDKGLVYGKLLYDDYPGYMLDWLRHRPRGLGIMPVTPYNKDFQHPQVVKWSGRNFGEVRAAMVSALARTTRSPLVLG